MYSELLCRTADIKGDRILPSQLSNQAQRYWIVKTTALWAMFVGPHPTHLSGEDTGPQKVPHDFASVLEELRQGISSIQSKCDSLAANGFGASRLVCFPSKHILKYR